MVNDTASDGQGTLHLFPEIDDALGPAPILMQPGDVINMKRAIAWTGRSDKTLRLWCRKYRIARQSANGSSLEISAPALEMVRYNDLVALELLRSGVRTHERVKRYFDHVGVPV
ncbi:hypothetical protein [Rhizobium sp. L245/93]|uniref:hypothetical protein n=1 Tax=Rhizobium sp. L245/93 TaxID=2819998 RepID=UPI001AD9FF70|nr:hypothetical protein [Rhizobium sp. L245/93]MBO9168347.1 hypothetical protein [Rhizobium sp. L245/93]